MITVTLKNGKQIEVENGKTILEITAEKISETLARNALVARLNGRVVEMNTKVVGDSALEILTFADEEGKAAFRHTCAHILAQAIHNIFPTAKFAIGPSIQNGFYYDFDFRTPISQADFEMIEKEMKSIIHADMPIVKSTMSRTKAINLLKKLDQPYKLQLLTDIPSGEEISFYTQGDFVDLCAGPHLVSTGRIKAFKLTSLTGAYWRGSEKNKMLTRIYGTAFEKKSDLEAYLLEMEAAKQRDHNKLGRDLGIFMTDESIGQGLPLLMPKGAKIIQILQRFVEDEEERRGYLLTKTPIMSKNNLFITSGHWEHYRDKMFYMGEEDVDDEILCLRPMTCPFQFTIYKNGLKSYRDLPIRYSETATLFRKEASGEMHGLIRIRQFTLADGHIVCTAEQLEDEFKKVVDLIKFVIKSIGLQDDVSYRFSRRDPKDAEKYIDDPQAWERAESAMKQILEHLGIEYVEAIGEAAFYGPKLDIQSKNVHGKEDTLFTVQIDFALAERFDMVYVAENGDRIHPLIIHRSSIGCYERTLAMLIEKYAGALPLWMSAVQVTVMSLTDRTAENAVQLAEKLKMSGIRAQADTRCEKINKKIRDAQVDKVPYMVILGDREVADNVASVRHRTEGDLGTMSVDDFVAMVRSENDSKAIK